tara:strand:- start:4988 stop:5416 length:429 start_codon:yes stop_codon:yes gene_type:complete
MKKNQLILLIREVVREEVQLEVRKILREGKKNILPPRAAAPTPVPKRPAPKRAVPQTSNPLLNDILQETANDTEWETMGGGTLDTSNMSDVLNRTVAPNPNGHTTARSAPINPADPMSQFLNKDYRPVMKASEQKTKHRTGK